MITILRVSVLIAILFGSSACTIRHAVSEDYPQYLTNNAGAAQLATTDEASSYYLPPETEQFSYEFRSAMAGYANLWVVGIGEMLDDTLQSADVQKAFGDLQKVTAPEGASGGLLKFELTNYEYRDLGAHISLNVSLMKSGKEVFSKAYEEQGKTQGGKMFWGGVWAMKNAIQQSTKLALDEILKQLIKDLNALKT